VNGRGRSLLSWSYGGCQVAFSRDIFFSLESGARGLLLPRVCISARHFPRLYTRPWSVVFIARRKEGLVQLLEPKSSHTKCLYLSYRRVLGCPLYGTVKHLSVERCDQIVKKSPWSRVSAMLLHGAGAICRTRMPSRGAQRSSTQLCLEKGTRKGALASSQVSGSVGG